MTNILQDGAAWLGEQLNTAAGVSVVYSRGTNSVSLTAVPTLHEYEIVDDEGFGIRMLSRDYLVHAADLVITGAQIAPRAGDRIAETVGGVAKTFEVMALGQKHEYEPADSDGLLLIVHTKQVG